MIYLSFRSIPLRQVNQMVNLTQMEMEALSPEDYSMFLAYGEIEPVKLNEKDYESYYKSYIKFDL